MKRSLLYLALVFAFTGCSTVGKLVRYANQQEKDFQARRGGLLTANLLECYERAGSVENLELTYKGPGVYVFNKNSGLWVVDEIPSEKSHWCHDLKVLN